MIFSISMAVWDLASAGPVQFCYDREAGGEQSTNISKLFYFENAALYPL